MCTLNNGLRLFELSQSSLARPCCLYPDVASRVRQKDHNRKLLLRCQHSSIDVGKSPTLSTGKRFQLDDVIEAQQFDRNILTDIIEAQQFDKKPSKNS